MHPAFWTFECRGGSVTVWAYDAALLAALAVFWGGGWTMAARAGLPRGRVFWWLAVVVVAATAGARLMHWAVEPDIYRDHPELLVGWSFTRFALQGGLLAALAAGLAGCWLLRIGPWRLADAVAPAIALGLVFVRAGCFLNGCCFGRETDCAWGVVFPAGSLAHLYQAGGRLGELFEAARPVHPTQLYEAAAALAAVAIALVVRRFGRVPGAAFLAAGTWVAAMQWVIFRFRAEVGPLSPLRHAYPWLCAGLALAGGALLLWRWRRAVRTPP